MVTPCLSRTYPLSGFGGKYTKSWAQYKIKRKIFRKKDPHIAAWVLKCLFVQTSQGDSPRVIHGYVIRPDGVSTAVASSYTTSDWATQEAAGSVFLPAAGDRNGTTVYSVGSFGTYWSSTFYESEVKDACCMFFNSSGWGSGRYHKFLGNFVRLVRDAN